MKSSDLIDLATRNLRESLLRNSLTTLGIAVGVASLVALLALGVGLQAMADNRLSRSGLFDTVVVFSRRDFASFDHAERQQRYQRRHAYGDAQRGERIAQQRLAQVARGQIDEVSTLHRAPPAGPPTHLNRTPEIPRSLRCDFVAKQAAPSE